MAFLEYQPKTPLFHYCGPGGFDGITESSSIWLSDLECANDPKELQLAAVIETLMLELIRDPQAPDKLRATYKALAPELQRLRRRFGMYSFSLSVRGDQLPMWQEYTERGRGFCIAFRATAFNDMSLRIQKVQYAPMDYFGSVHGRIEEIVRPLIGGDLDQLEQIFAMVRMLSLVSSVKNDSWEHEEEVRLVFSSIVRPGDFPPGKAWPISLRPDGSPVFPEDPLYRERQGQLLPYHIQPFGRLRNGKVDASGAIEQVIIGPNNYRDVEDVTDHLYQLGYRNFEVVRSRCAFR